MPDEDKFDLLTTIVRDLGRFETRLDAHEKTHVTIVERLESIDKKLSAGAVADANRVGMVKGGYWVLGFVVMVIASMSSALTLALKSWLGLIPPAQ